MVESVCAGQQSADPGQLRRCVGGRPQNEGLLVVVIDEVHSAALASEHGVVEAEAVLPGLGIGSAHLKLKFASDKRLRITGLQSVFRLLKRDQ